MEQLHQWAGTSPPGGLEGVLPSVIVNEQLLTHMMNSLGWQTTEATPPIIIQGLTTVWPPVTDVPPSSAASRKPRIISGITRSRSCDTRTQTLREEETLAGGHEAACRAYLLVHLLADAQQHQHVVTLRDAHGVEVAQHVSARYPALSHQGFQSHLHISTLQEKHSGALMDTTAPRARDGHTRSPSCKGPPPEGRRSL